MLELQKYLQSNSPQSLEEKFGINFKRHTQYPNLILFKYDQIECAEKKLFGEKIVQECRGIILDENNNWKIVARAFDKFFNYGESYMAEIDWKTAVCLEKIDGSLILLTAYNNQWNISTTGSPDAGGEVKDFGFSFKEYFWKTFEQLKGKLPNIDCNHCFMFELTGFYNKIVVHHKEVGLTLLGARDLITQQELTAKETEEKFQLGLPVVKLFPLNSIQDITNSFQTMSPLQQEGYVVCDKNFNRVKVKHPGYVALHHLADGLGSKRRLYEVVRAGEISEVVATFPEYKDELENMQKKYEGLALTLDRAYVLIRNIPDQKDFAIEASKTQCRHALFSLRAGKVSSIKEYLKTMRLDNLIELLEKEK